MVSSEKVHVRSVFSAKLVYAFFFFFFFFCVVVVVVVVVVFLFAF